ncbi:Ribose/Galactose Isomerase [uncultured archaeon]|nr:Ribose/Galactose Isomerase [uncultured archaeon]
MKLLVLSNVPGAVDRVIDLVQQHGNVVAKESMMTNDAIAYTAQGELHNGTYDQLIVIAKDPIGAGMILNKQEDVEAAVCDSAEDVKMANSNGANVIVIRNPDSDSLGDILNEAVGRSGASKIAAGIRIPSFARKPEPRPAQGQAQVQRRERERPMPAPKKVELSKEEAEAEEKLESLKTARNGNLVGKLKDALGIL